ncbi:tRNA (guanosine(46)-N7)-methyltransferase TrmB [Beggiatoa alba]|nr:tRNA (guanosine(46)-N7)-methyltransferase TrmB [Beggiatoa alba]
MQQKPSHPEYRRIRSFVRREGRLTQAQKLALEKYLPTLGLPSAGGVIDFATVFKREAATHLEIGFGNGQSVANMAATHPENNYLGVEVHRPGVGNLLQSLHAQDSTNVRVMVADVFEVLQHNIADNSLAAVYIYFPDPWHKRCHHKRRLVQTEFIEILASKMATNALLHMATDWKDYAKHMMNVMNEIPQFKNHAGESNYSPRPDWRTLTKFEQRGQRLGHDVWDLMFTKR